MNCTATEGNTSEGVQCLCLRCTEGYIEREKQLVEQIVVNFGEKMNQNIIEFGETLNNTVQSHQHMRNFFKKTEADIEKMKRVAIIQKEIMRMLHCTLKKKG